MPKRIRNRILQTGVTELIKHHKVATALSQPWRGGRIEAVDGADIASPVSGTGARALLALGCRSFARNPT